MKLIIGGAYQGKLDFALDRYGYTRDDVYFCGEDAAPAAADKPIIYGFENWILALVKNGKSAVGELGALLPRLADKIIIANDISAGVVPADPTLRLWREETGRATVALAREADEVYRIFVGIPTKLK
jgi:adenosyl cobinamide kinase/adenosyl cobinamide phosphate guanylyltransferase